METVPLPPEFGADWPSGSAFVAVCLLVVLGVVVIYRSSSHSPRVWRPVAVGLGAWMLISYVLASSGALRELAGSMKLGAYVGGSNLAALVLALSPVSAAVASRASAWMLVAFQGFRLPLELILHHWFEIGVMPIQMTYEGANFDIVTGVAAVSVATVLLLGKLSERSTWWWVLSFNVLGFLLLLRVMSIAVQSAPWPLRTFENEPAVVLPFYAPFTWIVPVCVAGALWGHVVTFRWLVAQKRIRSTEYVS
jgi:hypothetical protein